MQQSVTSLVPRPYPVDPQSNFREGGSIIIMQGQEGRFGEGLGQGVLCVLLPERDSW